MKCPGECEESERTILWKSGGVNEFPIQRQLTFTPLYLKFGSRQRSQIGGGETTYKENTIACVDSDQVNYGCISSDFYSQTSMIEKRCDPDPVTHSDLCSPSLRSVSLPLQVDLSL